MSNTPAFGRDAKEFLSKLGVGEQNEPVSANGVRITAIVPSGSDKKTVRVLVSNPSGSEEVEFIIMNAHVERLSLAVGEIDPVILPELEYFAEVAKAYSSACSSFAFAPSSFSALYKKLIGKGFPKDVCCDAIEFLKLAGFVKEGDIALRRAQIMVDKRWGRGRIIPKLREEGFSGDALDLAVEYMDSIDFGAICAEHIRKKFGEVPEDPHDRKLMYASLARMGFSSSDIKDALKLL
jgi:SOS response regulatory protein OraA/RecX